MNIPLNEDKEEKQVKTIQVIWWTTKDTFGIRKLP